MKKTFIVTLLLVISLSLLYTQAFAFGPSADNGKAPASGAVLAKPKTTRTPQIHKTHQPDDTDESETPEATETADDDNGKPDKQPKDNPGNDDKSDKVHGRPTDKPQGGKPTEHPGNPSEKAKHNKLVLQGVITAVNGDKLTITLKDGTILNVVVTADSSLKIPSLKTGDTFTFKTGERVVVQVEKNADGTFTVLQIHLIPGKPEIIHRVGTVTAYTKGTSITIAGKDGLATTFKLTTGTVILPADLGRDVKAGDVVTIISPRDTTGGDLTAKGIVVHVPDSGETEDNGTEKTPEPPEKTETP